jgi:hypothetical protein
MATLPCSKNREDMEGVIQREISDTIKNSEMKHNISYMPLRDIFSLTWSPHLVFLA